MFDPTYTFIGISIAVAVAAALAAFYYAARHGQLQNLENGSKIIFDDQEPIGQATDAFPGAQPGASRPSRDSRTSTFEIRNP